jgi:hypothetical protein
MDQFKAFLSAVSLMLIFPRGHGGIASEETEHHVSDVARERTAG